jgi:hypothetical protein
MLSNVPFCYSRMEANGNVRSIALLYRAALSRAQRRPTSQSSTIDLLCEQLFGAG